MIKKYLLFFVLLLTGVNFVFADAHTVDEKEQAMLGKLAKSKTADDSIKYLYNLFDLVPRKEKFKYANTLYALAERQNRNDIRLDLLRNLSQLANSTNNPDSLYSTLSEECARIPRSQEQEETALFIRMRQVAGEARESDAQQVEVKIAQLIAEEPKAKDLPMNLRVLRLFTIVEYLTTSGVEGNLLGEYVGMLRERMNQANFKLYALNNILLTESANIYSSIGNQKEAVAADKELLKVIEQLEKNYHSQGRLNRNYTANKYIIYRRMLGNYQALTPHEVEEYYAEIRKFMEEDEDVANTENNTHLAELCYSMATGKYSQAIPLIRRQLDKEVRPAKQRRLIRWLQIAAEGIGDKDTQIEALKRYNALLVERDTSSSSDRSRELDIRTRVAELKADNTYLQLEKQKEEKESYQKLMSFVMIGWVIFALILVIMLFYWAKYRAASVRISDYVKNLDDECDYLKEQHYHDYMHDNRRKDLVEFDKRKTISRRKRSKSIIDMMNYIMNDILYIASIGKVGRGKFVRAVSVLNVIDDEVATAKSKLTSGATMEVICPEKDIEVRTDKECLEYVLRHIFFAANRVAEGGIIRLEVKENKETDRVEFIFTNTSVNVPEGNEDVMFDNFIDVANLLERNDGGLFIVRLSAMLIDSQLYLERNYTGGGSQYVFSISRVMGKL